MLTERTKGLRGNAHHHVSRTLVQKYHTLGIESLNVAGMIRAGLQPKALSDAAMSDLLRQIRYKAQWYGTTVVEAERMYPQQQDLLGLPSSQHGPETRVPLDLPQLRGRPRPERKRSSQPAETCATR